MMHNMSLNFFVYFLFEIVNNLKAGTNIGMKNYNQQIFYNLRIEYFYITSNFFSQKAQTR